jgi:hypothetical protein
LNLKKTYSLSRYKHLTLDIRLDLQAMLNRYIQYGWTRRRICAKWGISPKSFGSYPLSPGSVLKYFQVNDITTWERQVVISYALQHTELRHREMAFRMMVREYIRKGYRVAVDMDHLAGDRLCQSSLTP